MINRGEPEDFFQRAWMRSWRFAYNQWKVELLEPKLQEDMEEWIYSASTMRMRFSLIS
jgi:hypothetical protein